MISIRSLFTAVIVLVFLAAGNTSFAQRAKPTVNTLKVTDNIYMLQVRGGNIGVSIGDDGILIIDNDYPNASEAIDAALAKLSKGDLEYVLNTHHHGDHTGGNRYFGAKAPIVAHDNVRVRLSKGKDLSDPAARASIPSVTFEDSLSLHFNGEQIIANHFPTGHTDGDSMIYFTKANVLHMGDHFFNGFFPYIDLGGGGDVKSYLNNVRAAIKRAESTPDVKIIPGHGPLATLKDLKSWEKDVTDIVAIIQSGMDAGKTLEQIIETGLPDKYAPMGDGFLNEKRFISIVHQSFTR